MDPELCIDPEREHQLTRKLDLFIAPIMTIIFLNAYLDRANIGNAASAGMLEDLGITDEQLGSRLKLIDERYLPRQQSLTSSQMLSHCSMSPM